MAHPRHTADRGWMAIVLLVCTGIAFLALMAAVPIEMGEERRDERERKAALPDR